MTRPKQQEAEPGGADPRTSPTAREGQSIKAAMETLAGKPRGVRVELVQGARGSIDVRAPHTDERGWLIHLAASFGSSSIDFALQQIQVLVGATKADASLPDRMVAVNAMLAIVAGLRPRDEVEGALAVQMAATHGLAVTMLERARTAGHIEVLEAAGTLATKLLRTYTGQVEALAKLRRGGNQHVTVEHVHVHAGGQAIVGNVGQRPRGEGRRKKEDQPHAPEAEATRPLTAQPVTPVWSQDPERDPVPLAKGEWAHEVPDAWELNWERSPEG
ncbi:MAG TPA: hypothetical protein VIL09_17625 [Microvirga sp.]|jgi:hypothetical protein